MPDQTFRQARWRRAGATDAQLEQLAEEHAARTPDEQAAEAARIDSISDVDLGAELTGGGSELIAGNKDDVLARVGDDPEKAAIALSHEQASKRPRAGVIEGLTKVIEVAGSGD
jgi:hypothetical protein